MSSPGSAHQRGTSSSPRPPPSNVDDVTAASAAAAVGGAGSRSESRSGIAGPDDGAQSLSRSQPGSQNQSQAQSRSLSSQHQEQEQQSVQEMPPFEPLFTLLTNTTTNTTIHPHVRYIFSDDDPSIIMETSQQHHPQQPQRQLSSSSSPSASAPASTAASALQDPQVPQNRSLVVDLVPTPSRDGWAVSWASSLSEDFAVTDSHLAVQQQEESSSGSSTTMLRVEGIEREPVVVDPKSGADSGGGSMRSSRSDGAGTPAGGSGAGSGREEDVDGLVDDFRRRMDLLRKVVKEGEKRREIVKQRDDHEDGEGEGAIQSREAEESTEPQQEQETQRPE